MKLENMNHSQDKNSTNKNRTRNYRKNQQHYGYVPYFQEDNEKQNMMMREIENIKRPKQISRDENAVSEMKYTELE